MVEIVASGAVGRDAVVVLRLSAGIAPKKRYRVEHLVAEVEPVLSYGLAVGPITHHPDLDERTKPVDDELAGRSRCPGRDHHDAAEIERLRSIFEPQGRVVARLLVVMLELDEDLSRRFRTADQSPELLGDAHEPAPSYLRSRTSSSAPWARSSPNAWSSASTEGFTKFLKNT